MRPADRARLRRSGRADVPPPKAPPLRTARKPAPLPRSHPCRCKPAGRGRADAPRTRPRRRSGRGPSRARRASRRGRSAVHPPAQQRSMCDMAVRQMAPLTSVESAARINLRWIVRLRWGAVAGQVMAILIARRLVSMALPIAALLAVCGALALANLGVQIWLDRARSDAEAAERLAALGTLAAGTAHELNTPLGTIQILAGELAAQLEGDRHSEAEEVRRQVKRCKEIISNMLAPRGGVDLEEPKEFEVAPVLQAAVRRWQEGRPGPSPELTVDPAAVRARARLPVRAFEQAIANLLDNAAEATEGRSAREVRVSLQRVRDELQLTVVDNGVGVPEPLLRRIGEPFFTTKEPGRGTGLGLYLARHVVERQGGEMRVDSAEGRGTSVTLTMPEV